MGDPYLSLAMTFSIIAFYSDVYLNNYVVYKTLLLVRGIILNYKFLLNKTVFWGANHLVTFCNLLKSSFFSYQQFCWGQNHFYTNFSAFCIVYFIRQCYQLYIKTAYKTLFLVTPQILMFLPTSQCIVNTMSQWTSWTALLKTETFQWTVYSAQV